jgi:hypothetical protein
MLMRSSLFFNVTQRRLVVTEISGQPICPSSRAKHAKKEGLDCLTFEDGPIDCPEISVTTNLRGLISQKSEDHKFRNVD